MTLTINLTDELYQRAADIAARQNIAIGEVLVSAFEEHLHQFKRLKKRAERGSYEQFLQFLEKVPDVEPPDYDRL